MGASQWFHADINRVSRGFWRGYIVETQQFVYGGNRPGIQEEARRIITETTGVSDPKIVWNEC